MKVTARKAGVIRMILEAPSVSHVQECLPDHTCTAWVAGEVLNDMQYLVVTPRQFRQALTKTGLRAQVEAVVAASDQDTQDWYEFATEFESTHPVVLAMAAAIGKTPADIEQVFALGTTL